MSEKVHKEDFRLQFEEDSDIMVESKGVKMFQKVPDGKCRSTNQ